MKNKQIGGPEILGLLRSDSGYMARNSAREKARDEYISELNQQLSHVVERVRSRGFDVQSVDELRKSGLKYFDAVPVLCLSLCSINNVAAKEIIVRALSFRWVGITALRTLLEEFARTPNAHQSLKWALGNAISIAAVDSVSPELIRIALDRRHEGSRQMIVLKLGSMKKNPPLKQLESLLDDPAVSRQAEIALKRLGHPRSKKGKATEKGVGDGKRGRES